jgi:hypothetical protein
MRAYPLFCAAIVATMIPSMALADDPRDPTMRSAAARARDSETTRQLNLAAGALVRERDARQMQRMQGWHDAQGDDGYAAAAQDYAARSQDYTARSQDHERDMSDYARNRARYERDMAAWRHTVAACRDGDYAACDE